ncbi:MAG: hypothetical protein HY366_01635 [Candidatus Aenigmarchaeota archaeon]|nr:hypothetical protein [Candidatus Aenigmarchaeota archaeon]
MDFKGAEIRKIAPVNAADPKGLTYEWCKGEQGMQVTVLERKRGVVFGNHYHTGADPSRKPEKHFLAKGKVKVKVFNGFTGQREEFVADEGSEIIIWPGVLHSFEALEDSVLVDYRCTVFDKNSTDTHTADTYDSYVKSHKHSF